MKTIKLLILSLCIFGIAKTSMAQDVIVKKDNSTILSKVVEITNTEIKYKKWSNQDGPTHTINKNEVTRINYQNGEVDNFNEFKVQTTPTQNQTAKKNKNYYKGQLSYKHNDLYINNRKLSDKEIKEILDDDLYKTYQEARRHSKTSSVFTIVGLASSITGLTIILYGELNGISFSYYTFALETPLIVAALVSVPITLVLDAKSNRKYNMVVKEYNMRRPNPYSLNVSPSLMKTNTLQSQANYGIGLTLRMNF